MEKEIDMKTSKIRMALIGSGGDGVMSAATLLMQSAADQGLYGMMTQSYGPQIRGGESAAYLNISDQPVYTENLGKDVVVCFRFSDTTRFKSEMTLSRHSLLIHEAADENPVPEWLNQNGVTIAPIPFLELLEKAALPELSKNIMLFGCMCRMLGWDIETAQKYVVMKFSHKSEEVIEANVKALHIGYENVSKVKLPFACQFSARATALRAITGNEACASAAIDAGCRFFAGYPITPSSEILENMIELLPKVGGKMVQAEDEIASVGMLVGASYGGIPSMTATSGPGLSLMTEIIGLASKTEIPIVIVDCQRAGPATGMPSRTEQSDLFHAVYGGHGDFPRVVLAPTDVENCWETMFRAFYIGEKYQLPVIVLSDAYIAQRAEIIKLPDVRPFPQTKRITPPVELPEGYKRFECCADGLPEGVSAMALPGMAGGEHYIAGIEQNISGVPSSLRIDHAWMNHKRFSKMKGISDETREWYSISGDPSAKTGLICWGSTTGVCREYVQTHQDAKVFVPHIIHPFPTDAFNEFVRSVDHLYFVELNFQGQLYHHVKTQTTLPGHTHSLNFGGGTPISESDIIQRRSEVSQGAVAQGGVL